MLKAETFDLEAFPAGECGWHELSVAEGLSGPVRVPIAVARGKKPGPTVFVAAGIHGDEYEGMVAIQEFFAGLAGRLLAGSFVGMPITNPFAFDAQTRESSLHIDGLNLARQFPGTASGLPTQRLASTLYGLATKLLGKDDLLIDFHSGGTRYEYHTMVGYHPTGDEAEKVSRHLARVFGIERLWEIPPSPNSTATFNGSVARSGIPTIGTEVRGRGGLVMSDVEPLVEGLRRVLVAKGMLEGDPVEVLERGVVVTHPVNCGVSGIFKALVDLDESVAVGTALAQIVSTRGEVEEVLVSPVEGRVWALRRFAAVRSGDQAFLIGAEKG